MTVPATESARMVTELVRLHQALQAVALPLDLEGTGERRHDLAEIIGQLEDYVIPRMMTIDAPLLAVVGGSTGAGKSTLVNSLVGSRVTESGLLRPTTRSPVLVHHPEDGHWFGQDRLLPQLVRVEHETSDPHALQLVASDAVPRGLAILDAPDVDSVEEQNRLLAAQLLATADLWLFVTSAARYSDQVPWEFLKAAAERSTAVAIVLDRTPDDAVQTVATHLARMLAARGLKDSPLFIVHEGPVSDDGLLPAGHVAEVHDWLVKLAGDPDARRTIAAQTLDGAIRSLTFRSHGLADAAAAQVAAVEKLRAAVSASYDDAIAAAAAAVGDGSVLRGDALAAWQELGASDALTEKGRKGKTAKLVERATDRITAALELLVLERAEAAAEQTASEWRECGGDQILAEVPDLARASRGLRGQAGRAVEDWLQDTRDIVRASGPTEDAVSTAVVAAVVGGTDVHPGAAQAIGLTKAVEIAERAKASLNSRIASLLRAEQGRFDAVLDALAIDPEVPTHLRQAARRVDDIRWAAQNDPLGM